MITLYNGLCMCTHSGILNCPSCFLPHIDMRRVKGQEQLSTETSIRARVLGYWDACAHTHKLYTIGFGRDKKMIVQYKTARLYTTDKHHFKTVWIYTSHRQSGDEQTVYWLTWLTNKQDIICQCPLMLFMYPCVFSKYFKYYLNFQISIQQTSVEVV